MWVVRRMDDMSEHPLYLQRADRAEGVTETHWTRDPYKAGQFYTAAAARRAILQLDLVGQAVPHQWP